MDEAIWEEVLNSLREIANALSGQDTTDERVKLENHPEKLEQRDSSDDDD